MTRDYLPASIVFMANAGRRITTPTDYKEAVARRVKYARELAGLEIPDIASKLSEAVGRKITGDTYRKWETTESSLPLDVLLPFCDLTRTHPYQLLAKPDASEVPALPGQRKKTTPTP